jgi:hypothetical protein
MEQGKAGASAFSMYRINGFNPGYDAAAYKTG